MRYKKALYLVFIVSQSGCIPAAGPLDATWPISYGKDFTHNSASVEEGYILLRDKDTLTGRIKLYPLAPNFISSMSILPKGKKNASDVINVRGTDIDYIRIYKGSFFSPYFTDFVNLDGNQLWRLLAKKGSVGIYDLLDFPSPNNAKLPPSYYTHLQPFIILLTHPRRVEIYSPYQWVFHHGHIKRLLVKFVNKYYKTSFRESAFNSPKEIFDYILCREAEKGASRINPTSPAKFNKNKKPSNPAT